jgi:hypothetical protein
VPDPQLEASILQEDNIIVDNVSLPGQTMIVVYGEMERQGLLLELTSALTGMGLDLRQAKVCFILNYYTYK